MQSQVSETQVFQATDGVLNPMSDIITVAGLEAQTPAANEPVWFRTRFIGCMEMYADAQTVANYLDVHSGWFRRCAHPMKAESIGKNAYALIVGRFGALGYQVEPKVGLELLPQEDGVYRIVTVPVPDYTPPGYDVDFQATQILVEVPIDFSDEIASDAIAKSNVITRVEWKLELATAIWFPKFIQVLPDSLIQKSGDRLLAQIVKQVSRRLTYKVQEDFHTTLGMEALEFFKKMRSQNRHRPVCEQCQ